MTHVAASDFSRPYARPFEGLLEAGFGSQLEMDCLSGLIHGHLERCSPGGTGARPKLFEIGTHRGAGICHFHAMAPELEIHSLNVLPQQLAALPRQMASEIIAEREIGRFAREAGISYTQHLSDSRTFDWEGLARLQRFDIVFVDGCHEQLTVMADTLNALRILKPGGMIIWHDYKVIDEPGRQVFAAVNDLDRHEFGGQIRHIEGTWLAFATCPPLPRSENDPECPPGSDTPATRSLSEVADEIASHLAHERRLNFAGKARRLPEVREVLFFSDHRNPVWPNDRELAGAGPQYRITRDPRRISQADIVVFHLPQVSSWHRLPKRDHQIWVGVTMEPDGYHPWQSDPDRVATLDLLVSCHATADLRLNYCFPGSFAQIAKPPSEKHPDKLVCAFISNSHSLSGRERLVERLERLLPVHHYGEWNYNRPGPRPEGRAAKLAILGEYHFCLALENCLQPDYVSEKWYDCLVAGCVPVYFGAPNIDQYSPGPGAFLDVRTFGPLEKLAETIRKAGSDPVQYARFFDWKERIDPRFQQLCTDEVNQMPLLAKIDRAIASARG